jgi:hypothetical protein
MDAEENLRGNKKKIGVILWLRETREDEFSDPNKKEGER